MFLATQLPYLARPKRLLHIAVVTESYAPEINGVAHTMRHTVETLLQQGHTVELTRPRQASDAQAVKPYAEAQLCRSNFILRLVRGLPIPQYHGLQMGLVLPGTLVGAWRKVRPDVVHIVTEGPLGWSALMAARRLGIPVSSSFHTNFQAYSRHYGVGLFAGMVDCTLRALHNRCAATMVPTAQIRESLQMRGYKRLTVVGRGIDTAQFDPSRRNQNLRDSWGAACDATVVMSVGRLAPEKNLSLFIAAALAMRAVDPRTRIVLVGDGPDATALRTAHADFIFAGARVGDDLAAHYASADVFLFPSITETFGNVTMEALASGLAVVAYDYAAAHQHIVDAQSGLLVPFDRAEFFVEAAQKLAETPELIAELKQHARATAESLSWARITDDFALVLAKVASKNIVDGQWAGKHAPTEAHHFSAKNT